MDMNRETKIYLMEKINFIIDKHIQDVLNVLVIEDLSLTDLDKVKKTIEKYVLMEFYGISEYVLIELYDMKKEFDSYVNVRLTSTILEYYNLLKG